MFSTSKSLISVIGTLSILSLSQGQEQECSQPTEGISFTFHACFKYTTHGPLEILWTRNGRGISRCTLEDGCLDYWEDETRTSMVILKDGTCQSNLTIYNVTQKECGMWKLNYLGPSVMEHPDNLYTCSLMIEVTRTNTQLNYYYLVILASLLIVVIIVVLTFICFKQQGLHEVLKKTKSTFYKITNKKSPKFDNSRNVDVTEILFNKV